jgi:hypothetical protein
LGNPAFLAGVGRDQAAPFASVLSIVIIFGAMFVVMNFIYGNHIDELKDAYDHMRDTADAQAKAFEADQVSIQKLEDDVAALRRLPPPKRMME